MPAATTRNPRKIDIESVSKRYGSRSGDVLALADVNLAVPEGEFLALLGPSGCGKTTLLRILAGLETASAGRVTISGRPVTEPGDGVGFVFQSAVLLPWRTVLSNVLLPIEVRRLAAQDWVDKAMGLLAMTGLADFAHHYPRELSGGMRQRAAICRALLTDPEIILMDEPFGALDAMTRDAMNEDLYQLWRGSAKTIVFVTHDIAEAVRLASRIAVMSSRPGRIERLVDTGFTSADEYAERSGSVSFLDTVHELRKVLAGGARMKAASPYAVGRHGSA
ncbi:MAG: ABC transporter ATP-binding protein [Alphaproteobacteria bacterium]